MENLLNDALILSDELAQKIQRASKEFETMPKQFEDFKPEAARQFTKDARQNLIENTKRYLNEVEEKISRIEARNNDEFLKAVHSGRLSSVATERTAAESQLQTALLLAQTKNKSLIFSEIEKAAANPNRSEFLFSMLEILPTFDFSNEYLDKIINASKKNPKIEEFYLSLKISDTIKNIRERVNYERRNLNNGIVNNNFSFNKQIRRSRDDNKK